MNKRFNLRSLRFNPRPPPIKGGREFSRDYYEAFYKIEDIFSHYVLGNIDLDHALKTLNYARYAIIPKLGYPSDVKKELLEAYDEAVKLLNRLRSREKVKEWLLSNGPPRETKIKSLLNFM